MYPKMQSNPSPIPAPIRENAPETLASHRGMGSAKTQTETLWILAQIRGPSIKTHHGRHHNYA